MILQIFPRRALAHAEATRLLPWYLNDTLPTAERRAVMQHLAQCADCRAQVAREQAVRTTLRDAADPLLEPAWMRFAARLDVQGDPGQHVDRPQAVPAGLRSGVEHSWRAALGVFALTAVLAGVPGARHQAAFHTLADPAATPAAMAGTPLAGAQLRAVFADTLTLKELHALLQALDARIAAGPSPHGVYTLALSPRADSAQAIARLRAHPGVRLAEPVHASQVRATGPKFGVP